MTINQFANIWCIDHPTVRSQFFADLNNVLEHEKQYGMLQKKKEQTESRTIYTVLDGDKEAIISNFSICYYHEEKDSGYFICAKFTSFQGAYNYMKEWIEIRQLSLPKDVNSPPNEGDYFLSATHFNHYVKIQRTSNDA